MAKKKVFLISFVLILGIIGFPVVEGGYYFIRGLLSLRGGFEGKSVRYLEKSVKTNPHFPEAYMLLALAYAE